MILLEILLENSSSTMRVAIDGDLRAARTGASSKGELAKGVANQINDCIIPDIKKEKYAYFGQIVEVLFPMTIYNMDKEPKIKLLAGYDPARMSSSAFMEKLRTQIMDAQVLEYREIVIDEFTAIVERACQRDYMSRDSHYWAQRMSLEVTGRPSFYNPAVYDYQEEILEGELPSKRKAMSQAKAILADKSFKDELNRIYSPQNEKKFFGHPVHYLVSAGTWDAAKDMIDILIPALKKNHRLQGNRIGYLREITPNATTEENFEHVFASATGGVVVVDLSAEAAEGRFAHGYHRVACFIGEQLEKYGKNELFIFVDVSSRSVFRDANLGVILGKADVIRLEEGFGDKETALKYLDAIVERSDFADFKEPDMSRFLPDKLSFTVSDVYNAYSLWYGQGLKSHVYKAYNSVDTVHVTLKERNNKPYEKLQSLVGLGEIKQLCDRIIAFSKVQNQRKELGLATRNESRHMIFYGNPGTAKTTVARLLAQILKEEGVLKHGQLVECGRQDLVGLYVGWTAKTVEEKFKEARGGVLFIDEAYSLVDDSNTFGDEAINTIVQLMENYRDEVIVILAGYPDKMREFIEKNDGLASRIAFHLNFPDYHVDEMMSILDLMLREGGFSMSDAAKQKCRDVFARAVTVPNFGNGRFVRNFLEKVEMNQSFRLASLPHGTEIGKAEITQLEESDIPTEYTMLQSQPQKPVYRMGFLR